MYHDFGYNQSYKKSSSLKDMNSNCWKIYNFLKNNDKDFLCRPFQKLVNLGKFKKSSELSFLKENNVDFLVIRLVELLNKNSIDFDNSLIDFNLFSSSNIRQKKYRENSKSSRKQLNFYLDIDTYKKLQDIKGSKTYQEVIQELLAK